MYRTVLTTLLFMSTVSAQTNSTMKAEPIEKALPQSEPQHTNDSTPAYLLSTIKFSEETKVLLSKHNVLIDKLLSADKVMNLLVKQANKWSSEQNNIKKGQMDTIMDKAERLKFSNVLRKKLQEQSTNISILIKQLDSNRMNLQKQRVSDKERWEKEANIEKIKKLEAEALVLKSQITKVDPNDKTVKIGDRLSEENVQYFTVDKDMNLRNIAWRFYNDYEQWTIIYDYPTNKDKIAEKSPIVLIPKGTILTIPNLDVE